MNQDLINFAKNKYEGLDGIVSIYTFKFIWVTDSFALSLGYEMEALLSKSLKELMVLDEKQASTLLMSELSHVSKAKDTRSFNHKDGYTVIGTADLEGFTLENEPYIAVIKASFEKAEND